MIPINGVCNTHLTKVFSFLLDHELLIAKNHEFCEKILFKKLQLVDSNVWPFITKELDTTGRVNIQDKCKYSGVSIYIF